MILFLLQVRILQTDFQKFSQKKVKVWKTSLLHRQISRLCTLWVNDSFNFTKSMSFLFAAKVYNFLLQNVVYKLL